MNFNSKRSVTDEQNERHKRMLAAILKEEGNKSCADCKTRNPTWASVNLGVFVCLTCSGIHRSLGVHISQVRSCNLDTWLPKQVEFCRVMGNVKGNRYWESRLPKDFRRPPSGNPNPELAAFIRAKYVDRAYAATDVAQPPTIDDYLDHPYAKDDPSNSSAASSASAAATTGAAGTSLLRGTPNKASASSPALTMDLLGGFDELASGPSCSSATAAAAQQQQQQAAAANNDPFSAFGTFVSAPPASSSGTGAAAGLVAQRNSLEWTDFHSATDFTSAPPTTALHPQALPPPPAAAGSSSGHHRSYSISEGVPTAPPSAGPGAASGHQPSRFSAAAATGGNLLGSTMPAPSSSAHHNHHHGHHNHHGQGHAAAGTPQPAFAPTTSPSQQSRQQPSGSDPFASLAPADDLLAGLTIHAMMESFATPSAASSTGGAPPAAAATTTAATATSGTGSTIDDLFTFSSSATPGNLPPPGAGHRRRPSQAKAGQEEVLRLFDAAPSTSSAAVGAAAADPFGDFLSAAPVANGHAASNGLGLAGVPNLL
ncbi:hypothetical protein CHLRE_06g304750v5 [Chlamydomonas reinhardtii]|uniref:Arf-GAP domain-containing protein n=1 Tax=Chlamydomonas reinhardtii TaxID=3055 RepID=A0A2K3DR86_CHLRE|nr:uncharacterized protein CHLRE_06g304750v5 [Chlamydomonas reinhardtii]PNW83049.1 hypothetical protein CHLRE_06g304750v5 [Chlamydomonas reinhardtii]